MATLPEVIARPLRYRSLLRRPEVIRELTQIAEDEPTYGNQTVVYHSGDALYNRIVEDILQAQERVLCEFYMFLSDETAWSVARALAERAKEGLEVRVIYDAIGSLDAGEAIFRYMIDHGVDVLEYRPIAPWKNRFGVFGRDHRKILVVDDRIGYLGGFNLGDYWSESASCEEVWRDTHLRLLGPAAMDLTVLFAETWHRETGQLLPVNESAVQAEHRAIPFGDLPKGGIFVIGGRGRYRRRIRRLYEMEIGRATEQLLLTNPYMIPDGTIREALCRAADRGVDVRLLLPEQSDVPLADLAGRHYFTKYLRRGIRVYLYQRSILHAKCLVLDTCWATVGSANLDSLSLNHNLECNAVVMGEETVDVLEKQFWQDLEVSREVNLPEWNRRSWKSKLYEWLASWLRPWL
jgi:cardiolipin synthase